MPVPKKKRTRRKKNAPDSRGLAANEILAATVPGKVAALGEQIKKDGGTVLATYREPLGEHWQILAALPVKKIKPTQFQRNLSEAHAKRLSGKIEKLSRYLDPITVVRGDDGVYYTPNGYHRSSAMAMLGSRSIIAMVIPEYEIAYQILALNTEKAYNLREKAIEAIRLARQLAETHPEVREEDFADQFEEPNFLTLGACYERKGNFSGGGYNSILKKTESFSDDRMGKAIRLHEVHATRLLKLDVKVAKAVDALKANGLKSPYLKTFVIARINPLRFSKRTSADFDETLDTMEENLKKFDPGKIQSHHLASLAGAPIESEN